MKTDNKNILKIAENQTFPFDWVDIDFYPNSIGYRAEIYLNDDSKYQINEMIKLFYDLFSFDSENILIYDKCWWAFSVGLFNEKNKDLNTLPIESQKYLEILESSEIKKNYRGSCKCKNWDYFLSIELECILTHITPFGHLFYSSKNDYFFYFHHTGSIGFYFKDYNKRVVEILEKADKVYDLINYN